MALADNLQIWGELDSLLAAAAASRSATHPISLQVDNLTVQFSSAEGLHCSVRSGIESTGLVDYDVELATEYWMADPIVERIFDGFMMQAQILGGELLGTYWKSKTLENHSFETEHGVVLLPQRKLIHDKLRVRAGNSKQVNPSFEITVGAL